MSDIFHNHPFEFSVPGDPDHDLPPAYFSIIPFRTSKFKDAAIKSSKNMVDDWSPGLDFNIDPYQVGTLTARGHLVSWCVPELSPGLSETTIRLCDMMFIWDG